MSDLALFDWLCNSLLACMRLVGYVVVGLLFTLGLGAAERPNIIFIMSDDMGYSDLGCYGGEIETPHLDRLAANGLRYTHFYNAGRCCPTRASLLTGLYAHQTGVGWMMTDDGFDGYRGDLNRNCITVAELLRTVGYRTYMSGKWHLTKAIQPRSEDDQHNWPLQRGFDRFYGTIHGAGSYFDPNSLARDNVLISPFADSEYEPTGRFYYTDAIADQAVRFVEEHAQRDAEDPFFLYLSFTAPHWPMHARADDVAKYRGKYDAGYQAIRDRRFQRMSELGVIDAQQTLNFSIDENWKEKDYLQWDIRNMEVYAAMVEVMDRGIGRLLESLRTTQQIENTFILYLQDNGGSAEAYGRGGTGIPRPRLPLFDPLPDEHLQTNMQPKQTREGFAVRTGKGVLAGPADTYIGYGRAWATVSNTPFREYKRWVHEGGIATPLIAHWPNRIHRRGELESAVSHVIDMMATVIEISGADYPETFHDDHSIKPLEGISLVPTFDGKEIEREALFWEHEGNRAVRRGNYKLVAKSGAEWELYDIAADRSEQHNLAKQHPEQVAELAELWRAFARRADVFPLTPYRRDTPLTFNRNKLRFTPQQGDDLHRGIAPFIENRGVTILADVSDVADGVVIAQGGSTHGWSVYFKDGRLHLAIAQNGQRTILSSEHALEGSGFIAASISKQGAASLSWQGEVLAEANLDKSFSAQPADGLQVGADRGGAVGDYIAPYEFPGEIYTVSVRISK